MNGFELQPPQTVTPEGETVDNTERRPRTPHYEAAGVTLYHGDCLDVLRELPDESVHAVVTDPPYGLDFMGKGWDAPGKMLGQISTGHEQRGAYAYGGTHSRGYADHDAGKFGEWCRLWALECLRVLKPGGHLVAFGGSRTWHRLAAGIEDAGFDIRDSIAWLYGSGFPKSLDVGKAIDKVAGAERQVIGSKLDLPGYSARNGIGKNANLNDDNWKGVGSEADRSITAPATDEAKTWDGWGTALKPAFEPIVVARKPLAGTVAANVLAHGTGAINIDATRVPHQTLNGGNLADNPHLRGTKTRGAGKAIAFGAGGEEVLLTEQSGRHTPNVALDDSQAAALDGQSGVLTSGSYSGKRSASKFGSLYGDFAGTTDEKGHEGSPGGASRFFPTFRYEAKAPTSERPVVDGVAHPTVKPLDLMRWLVRLVTPKGGTVLEPFAGSGTTVEACIREGFDVIAIEREADYLPLIEKRIRKDHAQGLDFDWGESA